MFPERAELMAGPGSPQQEWMPRPLTALRGGAPLLLNTKTRLYVKRQAQPTTLSGSHRKITGKSLEFITARLHHD